MPNKVIINQTAFREAIMDDAMKKSEAQMASYAINNFNFHKNTFLREFNDHEISKELVEGNEAHSSLFSWGSLFAFIGFQKGDDPIHRLDMFFKKTFVPPLKPIGKGDDKKVKKINSQTRVYKTFGFRPDLKDIEKETLWPWTKTGSWALDIEEGKFLKYAYYIYGNFDNVEESFSKRGLQSKKAPVRYDTPSKPSKGYLRTLLDEFDSRF